MKKILLSFADEKYRPQQNILHLSSKSYSEYELALSNLK
jgi:hypothetical protein